MSLHRRLAVSAAAGALILIPTVGHAAGRQAAPQLSELDRIFLATAAQANHFEIASGNLAQSRGNSPTVRMLGAKMVVDHTAGLAQLETVAAAAGVDLPDAPNAAQRNIVRLWSTTPRAAFDCAFVPAEYFDHIVSVKLYAEEANNGTNPAVRAHAQAALPVLQLHRKMVDLNLKTIPGCS